MIRCVGAALRGDGNLPEVPVIRTVLRAYNGVWVSPSAHECRTLCAQMPCLPNDFAKQSIVSYIPGGRTYKKMGFALSVSAPFLRQRIYTFDSEKGMMVFFSGRCAPGSLASSIEDSTSRPSELRKRTLVLVLGQVVLTEPCGSVSVIRWIIATLRISPRRFAS